MPLKTLFSTTDPLNHPTILLKKTLEKHIALRHPEMSGQSDIIRETIKNPLYIGNSVKHKKSLIFLNASTNPKIPFVIVATREIKKWKKYIVLTAFFTKNLGLNKLNKILWENKTISTIPIHPSLKS